MTDTDQAKINAIKEYFENEFPSCSIYYKYNDSTLTYKFIVHCEKLTYRMQFIRRFWDDCKIDQIANLLELRDIAKNMRDNEGKIVIVSREDIDFEET